MYPGYMSAAVRNVSSGSVVSGLRQYSPRQELPSPRYGNCIVDGKQTVSAADNAAIGAAGVDADRHGHRLTQSAHRLYLSVGHDEYWSGTGVDRPMPMPMPIPRSMLVCTHTSMPTPHAHAPCLWQVSNAAR